MPWSSLQATNQPMPEREREGEVLAELEVRTFGHGDVTLEPPAGG